MALRIYNTFTRAKEDFTPLVPGKVTMYVCGVTVYDLCHIGHARAYVAFDVVQRYLRHRGYQVVYVRNFTDVDDKIIKRAQELGLSASEVSERFIQAFYEDMEALGVAKADVEPRVTDHIPQIIETIQKIIERGHAYVADGDVYFDITSFPGYLALSGRKLSEMVAGASERVDPSESNKRHPLDFALWKRAKPGEPAWESPWGPGRPGWHIECSTMSSLYLGEVFDIHGGGMDLIFPHHENERAQSWAATGKEFVRYWMHNGFVTVGRDQEKMAKSLKNFYTIRDVTARYDPEALRYFLLTTHYRSPINFTEEAVADAEDRVEYLYESLLSSQEWLARQPGQPDEAEIKRLLLNFEDAMDDDFNTALALAGLADDMRELNDTLMAKGQDKSRKIATYLAAIGKKCGVLGLCQRAPAAALAAIQDRKAKRRGIDKEQVESLVAERAKARAEKDYKTADAIRERLRAMGVQVMDTPSGTRWKVA